MPKVLMVNLGKCHTTDGKIGNKWCIVSKEEIEAGKPLSTKQIHVYVHKKKTLRLTLTLYKGQKWQLKTTLKSIVP